MATQLDELYETDFYAWTKHQATALRRLTDERWNGPLDLAHLSEEIEDLGDERRNAALSQLRRIIVHCLKLEFSLSSNPRIGWKITIDSARDEIAGRTSKAIRREVEDRLADTYARALRLARKQLIEQQEPEAARALPGENPYALDDLIADDWYPTSRHGLVDDG
jgi:hypothetical protein